MRTIIAGEMCGICGFRDMYRWDINIEHDILFVSRRKLALITKTYSRTRVVIYGGIGVYKSNVELKNQKVWRNDEGYITSKLFSLDIKINTKKKKYVDI